MSNLIQFLGFRMGKYSLIFGHYQTKPATVFMETFAFKIKQIFWVLQGNIRKMFKKLENNQQRPLLYFYFL